MPTNLLSRLRLPTSVLIGSLALAVAIGWSSYAYYQYHRDRVIVEKRAEFRIVSSLQAERIERWREERINDGRSISINPLILEHIASVIRERGSGRSTDLTRAWLQSLKSTLGYHSVLLCDTLGRPLVTSEPLDYITLPQRGVTEAVSRREVLMSDMYRSRDGSTILMSVVAPIMRVSGTDPVPLAVLILRINPTTTIYPILREWPSVHASSESYLVRLDGDTVVFLSPFRFFRPLKLPLRHHVSVLDPHELAVLRAGTGFAFAEGLMGVPAAMHVQSIPRSSWRIVAQVDEDELFASLRRELLALLGITLAMIVLSSALVSYRWRSRQAELYRQRLEAEEEYRLLAENVGDVVWLVDAATERFTYVSPSIARLRGLPPERIIGEHVSVALAPADTDKVRRILNEGLQAFDLDPSNAHPRRLEIAQPRADGTLVPTEIVVTFMRKADGRISALGVTRDISERKQAESALRTSERQYRTLFDTLPIGIIHVNAHGEIISANPAAAAILGLSVEEILGHPIGAPLWRAVREDGVPMPLEEDPVIVAIRTRRVTTGVIGVHNPLKNATIWLSVTATPQFNPASGEVEQIYTTFEDVSDRRREQAHLRQLSLAINQASASVMVTNPDGVIEYVNQAACRTSGYEAHELIGQKASILRSGETPIERYQELWSTILAGKEWKGEFRNKRKDGSLYWEEVLIAPVFNERGTIVSFMAVKDDTTKQREIQAHLNRAQRLESIGTLAGGMAHDLNNVLGPIVLSVDSLRSAVTDEQALRTLDLLEQSALRGAGLVRQVLSFARGSDVELEPRVLPVGEITGEIQRIILQTFPKEIRFRLQADPELRTVCADATQLHQVIMNLCVNARDAMPNGGDLTITLENVSFDESYTSMDPEVRPGEFVAINVADTGQGIRPEMLDRIFDPFYTTKPVGQGTGLGLSTLLSIVKAHQGFVKVRSDWGKGSTFSIYLPVAHGQATREAKPTAARQRGNGELILLVEDDDALREVAVATLDRIGYRVLQAPDGAQAVTVFAEYRDDIRLVLIDMIMPHLDGAGLIAILRKMNAQVKILALSGRSRDLFVGKLPEDIGFLQKPYTAEVLSSRVREAIDARLVPAS